MRQIMKPMKMAIGCVLVIGVASGASSQGNAPPPQLVVAAAEISADGTTLFAFGVNFGSNPSATLAGMLLGGVNVNAAGTALQALMPSFPPGSYLLQISRGPSTTQNGGFIVTVGAVGPQGDKGDKGDKGDPGDVGLTGPQGDKGDQGIQGAKGDQGLQGAKGDQGDKGDQGIQGVQGILGIQGVQGLQGPAGLFASFDALAGLPCTSPSGKASAVALPTVSQLAGQVPDVQVLRFFEGPLKIPICPEPAPPPPPAKVFQDLGLVVLDPS